MGIKQRKKICKGCGAERFIFSKGLCKNCVSSNSNIKKRSDKIIQITCKKVKEKQEEKEKRDIYFKYHIKKCIKSDESGVPITNPTRANICHIFPKAIYKSLEDNIKNCIYLTFTEHSDFDRLLYSHRFEDLEQQFPNSFKKACMAAIDLLPLCKENRKFKVEFEKYLTEKGWKN